MEMQVISQFSRPGGKELHSPHEYASSVLCSPAILASAFPRPFAPAGLEREEYLSRQAK